MRHGYRVMMLLGSLLGGALCAEEVAAVYFQQGVTALKASDIERPKLLEAIGHLTKAAQGFDKEGNEQSATDANALLYWCRKKLTIDEISALQKMSPVAASKADAVVAVQVKPESAGEWLTRANDYAARCTDPLLKAVRYFEVADRFKGTAEGMKALDLSLKLMQDATSTRGVVGTADKGDGKVFVQSEPPGASILVEAKDGLRDTGVKTPGLVMVPKGRATLILRKDGCADGHLALDVPGDTIAKPAAVQLERLRSSVDVTDTKKGGWLVFVNGKSVNDKSGKQAVTPCTLQLNEGEYEFSLAKDGFLDVTQPVEIRGATVAVVIKVEPVAGKSRLLTGPAEFMVGRWVKTDTDTVIEFKEDGSYSAPSAMLRGRWKVEGDRVILSSQGTVITLTIATPDLLSGKWELQRRKK